MKKSYSIETNCIHTGTFHSSPKEGVNTPVYASSSYRYRDLETNIYPRYFNTINQNAVVEKLCALEGGEDGLLFSSGMAAISTTLFSLLSQGDHVVFSQEIYGGTYNLILSEFSKRGIEYSFISDNSVRAYENSIKTNTKLLYLETPSNPLLSIVDIQAVANLAKGKNIITVIDNTFASPINQNPILLSVDVVIHSGTKYLGGHSDLCFGAVVTSSAIREKILKTATNYGGSLNALDCHLIERSMKTLALRVERQNENALKIAQFLENSPEIKRVFYPGLISHPGYEIAKKQMRGFGGMLSFELISDDKEDINTFFDSLSLIQPALSLGGVESIICSPAATSHAKMPKAEREKSGISDGLLRLSVGVENSNDLIEDIKVALRKVNVSV